MPRNFQQSKGRSGMSLTGNVDVSNIRNQPITLQQTVLDIISQFFFNTPHVLKSANNYDWVVLEAYVTGLNSLLTPYVESWNPEYTENIDRIRAKLDDAKGYSDKRNFTKILYGEFFGAVIREFGNPDIALLPVPRKSVEM